MITVEPMMTTAGRTVLQNAVAGGKLTLNQFLIGSGGVDTTSEVLALTDVKRRVTTCAVQSATMGDDGALHVTGVLFSADVSEEAALREIALTGTATYDGSTATGIVAYVNFGENAETIKPQQANVQNQYNLEIAIKITDMGDVEVTFPQSGVFAKQADLSALAARVTVNEGNITLLQESDTSIITRIGVVESDLSSHVNNTNNPHRVTKAQIGLGNVSNVTTNNLAPTFEEATSNLTLTSGSTLSTLFSRIARAVRLFYEHLTNTGNPHSVTLKQAAGFVVGTYIGNAGVNTSDAAGLCQTINVGFTPMRVMVFYPIIGGVSNAATSTHGNMSTSRTYYFDVIYNVYCADCGDDDTMGNRATVKPSTVFAKRHGGGVVVPGGFTVQSSYVNQYSEKYPNLNSYNMRYVYVAWMPQGSETIPEYIKND